MQIKLDKLQVTLDDGELVEAYVRQQDDEIIVVGVFEPLDDAQRLKVKSAFQRIQAYAQRMS